MRSGIKYSIPWAQKREKKRRIIRQSSNSKFNNTILDQREKEGREDGTGMAG